MKIVLPGQNVAIQVPSGVDPIWYEKLKFAIESINLAQNASGAAGLPPAGVAGRRAFVSDATATTFASIVAGGGTNKVPVYDDGVNWRIG